ncbi:hypothetical protein HI914_02442 [Erysiphe necator]|nr:hypothetical protein HI914_02442 [Erysiphe necator]
MVTNTISEEKVKTENNPMVQKYSRYLTVKRIAANSNSQDEPQIQKPPVTQNDVSKAQSMGRYRRPKLTSRADSALVAPVITVNKSISNTSIPKEQQRKDLNVTENSSSHQPLENEEEQRTDVAPNTQMEQQHQAQEDKEIGSTVCQTNSHVSAADLLAVQKVKDLQRLKAQLDASLPKSPHTCTQKPRKENRLVGLFSKKKESNCSPPNTPKNPSPSSMTKSSPVTQSSIKQNIEQGGGGIVPQIDAPISAINAGERRVLVRFKQSSISLPINLETTAIDLIYTTADVLNKQITPSSTILLESFLQLGLERQIRTYERIRDVMNSWDRDTQNALIIEKRYNQYETELETNHLTSEPPAGVTVVLQHSQKPGKWKKRYVTLLASGQIFIAKNAGAKSTDKDYQNICRLSDFDIYKPMSERARKNHNPPEKNLYAIKSQQKTSMFLSSENYVHYFSTHDDLVGQKFYNAVQNWRSWFLLNRMGEGNRRLSQSYISQPILSRIESNTAQTRRSSIIEKPNSSKPLQASKDLNQVNTHKADEIERSKFHFEDQPSPNLSVRRNSRKYAASPNKLPIDDGGEFASSSLLGRTYAVRKRELHEETINQQRNAIASVTNMNPDAQSPRGLVDLTASTKEPPQWSRSCRGHGIRPIDGVPLVDIACSPRQGSQRTDISRSNTLLGRKDSKFSQKSGRQNLSSAIEEGPFVEGGLIATIVNCEANSAYKSRTAISNFNTRSRY